MTRRLSLLVVFVLVCTTVMAQRIQISASASLMQACVGDTLKVSYVITGDTGFHLMAVKSADEFRMAGQSTSQERQTTLVKGKYVTTQSLNITYSFIPLKAGTFQLPVLGVFDSKGQRYYSPAKTIPVVTDCHQRMAAEGFEDPMDKLDDFYNRYSIFATDKPYIISVFRKDEPGQLPDETVLKTASQAMKAVAKGLPEVGYQLIGRPGLFYTLNGLPHIFFGVEEDTANARMELNDLLADAHLPLLSMSILTAKQWNRQQDSVKKCPEQKLVDNLDGIIAYFRNLGENMDTSRNVYVQFTAKTKATRDSCKAWAEKAGFRVSKPEDVTDDKPGHYFFWVSFSKPLKETIVLPPAASIVTGLMERYGRELQFEGFTSLRYKSDPK